MMTPLLLTGLMWAAPPAVPDRQIPPSVLAELREIDNRFEIALAQDCAPERCFSKGCTYGDHATADRPRSTALPGLAEKEGPGAGPAQEYLTLARCSFAYERDMESKDAAALTRRLQTKLSSGWTRVQVSRQRLPPINPEIKEAPKPPEPEKVEAEPEPIVPMEPEPVAWTAETALRELWVSLLPHFSWMIAVVMVTLAAMLLIWGWRRLGRISPEEQMLLAQLGAGAPDDDDDAVVPEVVSSLPQEDVVHAFVQEQQTYWAERLSEDKGPDPDVRALIAQWLRADERGLLAKAVLTFPEAFPPAFPDGGEYADAKLRFTEYLRDVTDTDLPSDEIFYAQLKQHALSASLGSASDAKGIASLRDDFGAAGLVNFIKALPRRYGALLFAHASPSYQFEGARLLANSELADLAEQLLQSNRMSRAEGNYIVALLAAAKQGDDLPPTPQQAEVTDVGSTFDAAAALSVLMPLIDSEERRALFDNARDRFGGAFPGWYRDILFPELLLGVTPETRANLMLELDARDLAAWLSVLPAKSRTDVMNGMPNALVNAVKASGVFSSKEEQLSRYKEGRLHLAAALQRALARASGSLEDLVA